MADGSDETASMSTGQIRVPETFIFYDADGVARSISRAAVDQLLSQIYPDGPRQRSVGGSLASSDAVGKEEADPEVSPRPARSQPAGVEVRIAEVRSYPNTQPRGQAGSYPNIQPRGQAGSYPNIQPRGQAGSYPNIQPRGQAGSYPNIQPRGQAGSYPNIQPRGQAGSHPDAQPRGQARRPRLEGGNYTDRPRGRAGVFLGVEEDQRTQGDGELQERGAISACLRELLALQTRVIAQQIAASRREENFCRELRGLLRRLEETADFLASMHEEPDRGEEETE